MMLVSNLNDVGRKFYNFRVNVLRLDPDWTTVMLHTKNSLDETGLHSMEWVKWGVTKRKDGLPFAGKQ